MDAAFAAPLRLVRLPEYFYGSGAADVVHFSGVRQANIIAAV